MRLSPFVLALVVPLATASAWADDPAAARAQLEAGYSLKEQGKYEEALPHLLESLRLDLQLKTLTNLADCEEHLGKLVDAQKHWVMARDRAGVEGNDRLRAAADDRLSALEKRMPKLTIRLAPGTASGAEVLRDGTRLGSVSIGLGLPTDPGAHTIVVRAKGHADTSTNVTLGDAEQKEIVVASGPEVAEPPTTTAETTLPGSAARGGRGTQKTLALVSAGVGGAGLVLGTIFGVSAINKWGTAEADCGNGCAATANAQNERSTALTDATVSTVAFIVGGVLVVGGAVLWLTAPSTKEAPLSAPVSLGVAPAPGGLSVFGAF